jgi:CPA1 family monovalent cation:H+ antiporter
MPRIDAIVALLALSVPLVALARALKVGYPVVLVLGGLALCFIPGLLPPHLEIHPGLVFLVFLPPLLYRQVVTAPTGEMRANLGAISSLAIGLVLATAVAVALIAKAIVPELAWPAALALGAIVAPTDDVAFWPVAERLHLPRRLWAMIGGEAMLNDASALLLYAVAVTAAVSGSFSVSADGLRLLWVIPASIAVGLLAGRLVTFTWSRVRDSQAQTMISVIAPYLAYLPASQIGLSGVLAVVAAGIMVNRASPKVLAAEARQRTTGFWETTVFVMNAILFVLIGAQLRDTFTTLRHYPVGLLVAEVVAVNAAVIGLRFAWIFAGGLIADRLQRKGVAIDGDRWKSRAIAAWSGLRGGVSLAAAIALPQTVAGGAPFAHRDLIILLAFSVILVTLVGQGLTLPWFVARLRPRDDLVESEEQQHAFGTMRRAALQRVDELERDGRIHSGYAERLRSWYVDARKVSNESPAARDAVLELVNAERASLIEARERGLIDNTVLRRMQAALDMEELRLEHLRLPD